MFYCVNGITLNIPWSLFMTCNNVMRHPSMTYDKTCRHDFPLLFHIRSLLHNNDDIYLEWYYGRDNLLTSKSIFGDIVFTYLDIFQ